MRSAREGRRRFRWESPPLFDGCKPDFVLSSPKRFGASVIYLAPATWRRSSLVGLRLLPGGLISFFRETGQATLSSCFVLHRMGFVMPPCFRSGRWALTPPFHPCFINLHGSCVLRRSHWGMKRFAFCDTFRRKELSFSAPPLSRGVPPCGVRTFLSGVPCGAEATVRHRLKDTCKPWSFKPSRSGGNGGMDS